MALITIMPHGNAQPFDELLENTYFRRAVAGDTDVYMKLYTHRYSLADGPNCLRFHMDDDETEAFVGFVHFERTEQVHRLPAGTSICITSEY